MKKKILIIQQYFYPDISAVSQLLSDLLPALTDIYEITVLCSDICRQAEEIYSVLPDTYRNIKIKRIRVPKAGKKTYFHRILDFIFFYLGTLHFIRANRKNYELAIAFTSPPLISYFVDLALGGKRRKIPLILYIEDLYPELLFDMGIIVKPWIISKLMYFNNRAFTRADHIITLGYFMTRKILNNYSVDKNRISEIPNWSLLRNTAEKIFLEDDIRFLYSGNLGLAHDFSLFNLILNEILDSNYGFSFLFIGGGRQFADVKKSFIPYEGKIPFSFMDYQNIDEHEKTLGKPFIGIISQRKETVGDILPSKFYSYLSSGCPILFLGPKLSEIALQIEKYRLGYIIESRGDIKPVLEELNSLVNSRDRFMVMSRHIQDYYQTNFGMDKSAQKLKSILSEVF